MISFERATVVSYIVTNTLSRTIWPQFAVECLRSNQKGVGHFGVKFDVSQILMRSWRDMGL